MVLDEYLTIGSKIISVIENNMFPTTLQNLQQKMLLMVFHENPHLGRCFLFYI